MITNFGLGDRIEMRKPHACGCNDWLVIRIGADVKLKCCGCARVVMMDRVEFLKRAKRIIAAAQGAAQAAISETAEGKNE